MLTSKSGIRPFTLVLAALAFAVLVSPVFGQVSEGSPDRFRQVQDGSATSVWVPEKALECNSLITTNFGAQIAVAGGSEVPVTLTVSNGLSRDAINTDVSQDFQVVDFFGSCTSTGPCVENLAMPVTYVPGSHNAAAPDACPGLMSATVMGTVGVQFNFGVPGFTLGPSMTGSCAPNTACDCTVDFRVFIPTASGTGPFNTEATTMGTCMIPPAGGFTSTALATVPLMIMPTMGEAALLALALILLAGAASILRRRGSADALGA